MQVYLSGAKFQSVPSPPGAGAKESADLEKSRGLLAGLVEDTGSIPMPDGSLQLQFQGLMPSSGPRWHQVK